MNKLTLIPILIGIIVIISIMSIPEETSQPKPLYDDGFTFYDIEKIESSLSLQNISMSTPVAITDHTIGQYCTFLDEQNISQTVEYCTTTSILNSEDKPIGNINMGGTIDGPIMALAILDTSDISSENQVNFVFETMIESLVCDCWDDLQPGGFESVDAWVNAAKMKYTESSQTTLKSKIDGLGGMNLVLEITSKGESYLWTLIVLK